MYDALTIAKWFVAWTETDESGEAEISNLKLQKLLYYAQGNFLAQRHQPLFKDSIEAWSHGPVVPAVYHAYKAFESETIHLNPDDAFEWSEIDEGTTQFLIDIWDTYGGIAAWKLRDMTHSETPWVSAYNANGRHIVIPNESLERHFVSLR